MTRLLLIAILAGMLPFSQTAKADLPAPGNNKVAYYVFDSGGPDQYPLTSFTDLANIVVIFEGRLWELADSAHYSSGWMRNVNYQSYSQIMRDIRTLQARGVKVLMNVDDAASWSTTTPFTTYDGKQLDYQQFAAFIKTCAIDSVHLDGISLDIEHQATANTEYIQLLKELGKYFGPLSSNSTSQIYTAALYAGGAPGPAIGKSRDITAYMNFIMDMAYFSSNYVTRFTQWADSIGASKVMIGVLNDKYDLARATAAAAWQPANPPKAGIMVYAANNLKSYTDGVFGALTTTDVPEREIAQGFALEQNYPNPFNPKTVVRSSVPPRTGRDLVSTGGRDGQTPEASNVRIVIIDLLGREVKVLVNERRAAGIYNDTFDASGLASGVYVCRLTAGTFVQSRKMVLLK